MLKEIKSNDLFKEISKPVYLLKDDKLVSLEDLFQGVRVLVDEPEATEKKAPIKKPGKVNKEEVIIKAWNRGEKSISDIIRETGYSYATVKKYIPTSKEG